MDREKLIEIERERGNTGRRERKVEYRKEREREGRGEIKCTE